MKRFIIALTACLVALTACSKLSNTATGCRDYCTVSGNQLISDSGYRYNVVQQSDDGWKSAERLLITFDVVETSSAYEYDINLTGYTPFVLGKVSTTRDGNDPVYFQTAVVTGSSSMILNMVCVYTHKKGSSQVHRFGLMYDPSKSTDSDVYFELTHEAFGDTYREGVDISECESVSAFLSFPLSGYVTTQSITIGYDWYDSDDSTTYTTTTHYTSSSN